MINKPFLCFFIVFTYISGRAFGQTVTDDSTMQKIAIGHVVDAYNTSIGQMSRLYNGPEYEFYDPLIKGNACFLDVNAFKTGSVNYDGIFYANVPMMYDINKDLVVTLLYNGFSKYSLINSRLQSFDLLSHHFVYVAADSTNQASSISSGLYEEIYGGNLQVLVKWTKSIQSISTQTTLETFFTEAKKHYYLKKGNNYYSTGGQGAFLNALKDKKKELQQYIKANKISFKDNPEKAMYLIAAQYDQLSK
ncbi:hypothetical protein [Mucilaginibacter ginsenosidivorax]|uniref:Uncharacterized protein n=1 Tax=Mucilaginibacter ginsenosidivorax TaxID=862126 RepID=A0A5B8VZ92_9SPHI|nr:hypothetical protein [Mucilaginibacter ginsenosidivorax]QEC76927.1 hypothetical protein FSB76_13595 [Mucilaginibacter ginsenosidivorax]